jgi:hypothetical protein
MQPAPADHERLRRLNRLLDQALLLDADERERWLAALPPAQRIDLPRLQALLARAEIETDAFLSTPLSQRFDEPACGAADDDPGRPRTAGRGQQHPVDGWLGQEAPTRRWQRLLQALRGWWTRPG